jgi:hypothetical protein
MSSWLIALACLGVFWLLEAAWVFLGVRREGKR